MSSQSWEQQLLDLDALPLAGALTAVILRPAAERLVARLGEPSDWLLDGVPIRIWTCPDTTPPGVVCTGDLDWWLAEGGQHHFLSIQVDRLEMRIDLPSGFCELHAARQYVCPDASDDAADAVPHDEGEKAEQEEAVLAASASRWSAALGHITVAAAVVQQLREVDLAEGARDELVLVLESLSNYLSTRCLRAFEAGRYVVHARPTSLLAPTIPLPADAWHHLVVSDWATGRLEARTGETFYSARVVISGHGLSPNTSAAGPSKSSALILCGKRLAEIIAASPNARTESKSQLRKRFVGEIKGLSERGFNLMWDQVIQRLGAKAWSQPGAIRKNKR